MLAAPQCIGCTPQSFGLGSGARGPSRCGMYRTTAPRESEKGCSVEFGFFWKEPRWRAAQLLAEARRGLSGHGANLKPPSQQVQVGRSGSGLPARGRDDAARLLLEVGIAAGTGRRRWSRMRQPRGRGPRPGATRTRMPRPERLRRRLGPAAGHAQGAGRVRSESGGEMLCIYILTVLLPVSHWHDSDTGRLNRPGRT
jgi:hypothetical protein